MADHNYNRNRPGLSDNNGQSRSKSQGGELRNGRLSQFKNHNPHGQDVPNEYISSKEEED